MRSSRIVLAALGLGSMLWGVWLLLSTQHGPQLLSIAIWLIGAVIAHDAVLVPVLTLLRHSHGAQSRASAASSDEA